MEKDVEQAKSNVVASANNNETAAATVIDGDDYISLTIEWTARGIGDLKVIDSYKNYIN